MPGMARTAVRVGWSWVCARAEVSTLAHGTLARPGQKREKGKRAAELRNEAIVS